MQVFNVFAKASNDFFASDELANCRRVDVSAIWLLPTPLMNQASDFCFS
ncbi:hypothetical protein [Yimella sp. cx-51]|nr:hypothetical protein [Yimella sp. cx-51]MBC9957286.1 hypothetical protein [Yimella sp. cx-51]QTH37075.1 hypothetical protein J5M86_09120 [Yimella sp. cx-51]